MKRRGFIDQFLMFMVVFVAFVSMLFLIIGYSNIARIQNNIDTMTGIVARMLSTGKSTSDVANRLNSLKLPYFQTVSTSDINSVCSDGANKIMVTISGSYNAPILGAFSLSNTSSAYNEQNSSDCNVTISLRH